MAQWRRLGCRVRKCIRAALTTTTCMRLPLRAVLMPAWLRQLSSKRMSSHCNETWHAVWPCMHGCSPGSTSTEEGLWRWWLKHTAGNSQHVTASQTCRRALFLPHSFRIADGAGQPFPVDYVESAGDHAHISVQWSEDVTNPGPLF